MNELDDLSICKRIAEIEGVTVNVKFEWDDNLDTKLFYGTEFQDRKPEFNPLTDDGLCKRLVVIHNIELSPLFNGEWCASEIKHYTFDEDPIYGTQAIDKIYNKAAMLCIISVHKES